MDRLLSFGPIGEPSESRKLPFRQERLPHVDGVCIFAGAFGRLTSPLSLIMEPVANNCNYAVSAGVGAAAHAEDPLGLDCRR
jgi:hypothetical protein